MTILGQEREPDLELVATPLSAKAFAPYGDVIESTGPSIPINHGTGHRYRDLATVTVAAEGGRPAISRVACVAEAVPVLLRLMERHPLGSQAFVPVDGQRYLVVVAPPGAAPKPDALRAFLANGRQGINYHRGTWHHPIIALDRDCEFVEVHRAGPDDNCEEVEIGTHVEVYLQTPAAGMTK